MAKTLAPDITVCPSREQRRRLGSYYTPAPIVEALLTRVLDPVLAEIPDGRRLAQLRVLDFACGNGAFLAPAWRRILARGEQLGVGPSSLAATVCGVDIDPAAVQSCLAALFDVAAPSCGFPNVECGDALRILSEADRAYDVILGNPPFRSIVSAEPLVRAFRGDGVTGQGDLSHSFMALALKLVDDDGAIGMVMPRAFLSAPACSELRANCTLMPRAILLLNKHDWFEGANVYVCCLHLGRRGPCEVRDGVDGEVRRGRVEGENWWAGAMEVLLGQRAVVATTQIVGDVFEVIASLTVGHAYDLRPFVGEIGPLKLVTTGLIERGACAWGLRPCRYLRTRYVAPRIAPEAWAHPLLAPRLRRASRPKVLVAGLGRRLRCFADLEGEYLGGASTYSVFHPDNDEGELRTLADLLNQDAATERLHRLLGATAMGGGSVTVTKRFVMQYPWPA